MISEAVRSSLAKAGATPAIETPEAFGAFIVAGTRKWSDIAKAAGISME